MNIQCLNMNIKSNKDKFIIHVTFTEKLNKRSNNMCHYKKIKQTMKIQVILIKELLQVH